MESLIVIIGIIAAIVNAVNKGKKVKKNAPGQAARPQQPVQPPFQPVQRTRHGQMNRPDTVPAGNAKPTVVPAQPTAAPGNTDFWQQIAGLLDEEEAPAADKGHEQVTIMPEGDSRECEHGGVGGSMAYDSHQEGKVSSEKKRREPAPQPETDTLYRPAMNAQEMRRAVVMAEILKRPQERMAEQARRWS